MERTATTFRFDRQLALVAFAILGIGGLFYVSYRFESVLNYHWVGALGLTVLVRQCDPLFGLSQYLPLPESVLGSVPTFLLSASMIVMGQAFGILSRDLTLPSIGRWMLTVVGFAAVFEIAQTLGLLKGFGSVADVVAAIAAVLIVALSYLLINPRSTKIMVRHGQASWAQLSLWWAGYIGIALLS
jgi:hypothetical protein